jgi:hypothetical protein
MSSKPDKQQYGENMDPNRNNPSQGQKGRTDQPGQQKENDKYKQQGGGGQRGGQQQR